ncbi:YceI family protein [Hymenobacter aerophilus]|uniref:YceI family protein n=1 Tax=Hymenobacter aerophilus TaxID=119644 RepID=UPI00037A5D71|nr:YceI family protein [Hymenobacter aerophilus]
MNKFFLPALLAASLLAAAPASAQKKAKAAATQTAAASYKLQPQLSTLGWIGKKVTGAHNGTMQFQDGSIAVRGNQIVGGKFVVDMTSLKVEDLKDADSNAKLVGHLRSDDFFSIDKNATSTFTITSITPLRGDAKGNNSTVTGDLTIKGITQRISFPAKTGVKGGLASATGVATIDRTKFDIKYGSKSFFESIGDKAIMDEFTLDFNVIAKK